MAAELIFWGKPDMDHLLQQVLGSVFYNNPVNIILYATCLIALVRKYNISPDFVPLLLWLSLPLIGILLWLSIFSTHTAALVGPLSFLMLLASMWLDQCI
jgi:hypothetical protein